MMSNDDIANLLVEARKNNLICFRNNSLEINIIDVNTYDNIDTTNHIKELIKKGSEIDITKYVKMNIIYACILSLKDPLNKNRIFISIGFSTNILNLVKKLKRKYKCNIHLIGLKNIDSRLDEILFSRMLKKKYKESNILIKINNKRNNKIYLFSKHLMDEFNNIIETLKEFIDIPENINTNIVLTNNIIKILKDVPNFNEYHKDVLIKHITKNRIKYELNIKSQDNIIKNLYELNLKDKELLMKDKELLMKDKEIEILKLQNKII